MAVPSKYQAKEVLNKVLNAGEDALNVDLSDSVTVTVDSEFPAAAALQDDSSNPTTTSVGSHLLGYDSGNTNWNRVEVDDVGHLQIDVVSSALPSGGATAANQATIIGHVDGIETLITSTNSKIDTFDAVLDAIKTDTQEIEEAVETIEGAVSGSEMQVDVVASLPAGTNNIGDVDIASTPTTSATISGQSRSATSYAALTGSNMTTDTHGIFSYVIQITSTDNCTLKVQGSNDNSNWVDDGMAEVTIATGASGLISGTSFFKYLRLQFKASATNGTTVNGQGYAK